MTLYGMDDELNSEAGADLVIGSDTKIDRGNASPDSYRHNYTGKKADYYDPD
jgi:hypothetical protein